jgi:hypothetical protein
LYLGFETKSSDGGNFFIYRRMDIKTEIIIILSYSPFVPTSVPYSSAPNAIIPVDN